MIVISLILICSVNLFVFSDSIEFVSRQQWGARPPKTVIKLTSIPKYVFIHHSYIPGACYDLEACIGAMKAMQNLHMDENGWADIGYSFAVGSDGRVYVGRGWDNVGAHTKGYNSNGLGFLVIGDYRASLPNNLALNAVTQLIEYAVKENKIDKNYILRGHRDVVATECPGQSLYDLIQTWPHYNNK